MTPKLTEFLSQHLTAVDFDSIVTVEAKVCQTFDDLIRKYKSHLTVTTSMEDCLAVCCAVHLAVKMDGDPLWIYLVGAPSSGKSTICELLSADEFNTRPLSKFTGLISGSKNGSHLAPKLHNKCVIVKDGTLLLECTPAQLSNVFGELRDISDGSIEVHYRNGVVASFRNISFGLIIGITEKVYGLNMAALGERFLHCRLETERETELSRNLQAMRTVFQETHRTGTDEDQEDQRAFPLQKSYTAGFLSHLHDLVANHDILRPQYTEEDMLYIQAMADIVSCSRARTSKDFKDNILYESRPETTTRVVKHLSRLALSLCYVYNVKHNTNTIRRVLKKITLDTAHSRQYHVINTLAKSKKLTRHQLADQSELEYETCRKIVLDLLALDIVSETRQSGYNKRGVNPNLLSLAPWIQKAFSYGDAPEANSPPFAKKKRIIPSSRPRPIRKVKKESSSS